jgi:WD40 repeat protein
MGADRRTTKRRAVMLPTTIRKKQYAISYPFNSTFTFAIKFWDATQISALLSFDDGLTADQVLAPTVDYSLTAPGDSGTLTRLTDWNHAAVRITILRTVEMTQDTDYRNGEAVDMDLELEKDFDLTVARAQQQQEQLDRMAVYPVTDPPGAPELPALGERRGKVFVFDEITGDPKAMAGIPNVPTTSFMADMLLDDNITELLTDLGISPFAHTLDGAENVDAALDILTATKRGNIIVTGDAALTLHQRHVINAIAKLSLPSTPIQGDMVEVRANKYCKVIQSDAEHLIMSIDGMFTTKGVTGYLQLLLGDEASIIYAGAGLTKQIPFTKIADPVSIPSTFVGGASFSPNGRFLAVTTQNSPYIFIYDFVSGNPVKIADPATIPTGTPLHYSAWSPDGRYLAVPHNTTPFVTIYDFTSGSPVKITNPATLPGGDGNCAGWSPDGRYMAIGHATTPFVTIYDWSTGSPIKIANPGILPAGTGLGLGWSADGRYLTVAHVGTPFITTYDFLTGTPIKTANPATLPGGDGICAAWSPDGRYLSIAHTGTPFMTVYDWATGVPIKTANPAILPAGNGSGCWWSPDGRYLAIGHSVAPCISIYDWKQNAELKIADAATLPTTGGTNGSWSPDGKFLAVGALAAPWVLIYTTTTTASKVWLAYIKSMFDFGETRNRFK